MQYNNAFGVLMEREEQPGIEGHLTISSHHKIFLMVAAPISLPACTFMRATNLEPSRCSSAKAHQLMHYMPLIGRICDRDMGALGDGTH